MVVQCFTLSLLGRLLLFVSVVLSLLLLLQSQAGPDGAVLRCHCDSSLLKSIVISSLIVTEEVCLSCTWSETRLTE